MLLQNRKVNESITTWKHGDKDAPLVIRVTEVSPAGTVTLGFGVMHMMCVELRFITTMEKEI